MNVNFDGRTYSFEVKPGIDGYKQFTEAIRKAFSLPEDSELNITFTCDEPIATPQEASPASTPISLGQASPQPGIAARCLPALPCYVVTGRSAA